MRKLVIPGILVLLCTTPVMGAGFEPPQAPRSVAELIPMTESFGEGLLMIVKEMLPRIRPDLYEAGKVSLSVIGSAMLVSVLHPFSERMKEITELAGTAAVSAALLLSANSMIQLGVDTVAEITEYGKLLLPVMTAAMAAQGRPSTSAALYSGSVFFIAVLGNLISKILIPIVYLYLALAVAYGATGDETLKQLREMIKKGVSWCLKTLLSFFIGYISVTGVISGSTDAAALKVAKSAISTVVPVVGGILSDASEAVLISVGLAKNAAGIYGIFAILAIFLGPFLRIAIQYIALSVTKIICGVFSEKRVNDLIADYSSAMGLLLAMTGSVCLLFLISTSCFIRGAS